MGLVSERRFKFSNNVGRIVKDAATYEPKRSMSNGRLISSGLSLALGLFIAYCSMFYVPAFTKSETILGFTAQMEKLPQRIEDSNNPLAPYADMFRLRRGYFKAGQTLVARYEKTSDNTLTLNVVKCESRPIIEIFNCGKIRTESIKVKSRNQASYTFTISEPGFYYFNDTTRLEKPYKVAWSRNS